MCASIWWVLVWSVEGQFFKTLMRPLFVSVEERIGMIVAALQDQWCHNGVCTGEDEKTIEAIVKNIRESGRRFW